MVKDWNTPSGDSCLYLPLLCLRAVTGIQLPAEEDSISPHGSGVSAEARQAHSTLRDLSWQAVSVRNSVVPQVHRNRSYDSGHVITDRILLNPAEVVVVVTIFGESDCEIA